MAAVRKGFRSIKWGDLEVGFTTAGPMTAGPTHDFCPVRYASAPTMATS